MYNRNTWLQENTEPSVTLAVYTVYSNEMNLRCTYFCHLRILNNFSKCQSIRLIWKSENTAHQSIWTFFFWSLPIKRSSGVWVCLCCGVAAVQLVVSTEMERSSASAADTQISTAPTDLWSDINSPHSLAEPCLVPAHWYHRHIPWCICWQLDQAHCNSFIMTLWP